ncbi:hypothetical protein LPJ76_000574 [Coemansia sp. RSA 638]|nr:hypothetical protein LPJ76_000574 [Coemansia sp. RSA 638]
MFAFKKSKGRRNIRKKETDDDEMAADSGSADIEEIQTLKDETLVRNAQPASDTAYPFSNEGIPDAQEIYMAKKLRRQRQAAQKMNGEDSDKEEDFISLSDNMANSQIRSAEHVSLNDAIAEGEDEMEAVIIDKGERAEFGRVAKQAMEESIDQAHDDEMSDWENEQLRNAGVSAPHKSSKLQAHLPKDNGFKFDMDQFKFIIAQDKNQLAIEQDRLRSAKEKLVASSNALDQLRQNIEQAQKQYDHFSSLAKSTI